MAQKRYNPRINSIHKAIFGKPHPKHVEPAKKPEATLSERHHKLVSKLCEEFLEGGLVIDQLAANLRMIEREYRRVAMAQSGRDYGRLSRDNLHAMAYALIDMPLIEVNLDTGERRQIPTRRSSLRMWPERDYVIRTPAPENIEPDDIEPDIIGIDLAQVESRIPSLFELPDQPTTNVPATEQHARIHNHPAPKGRAKRPVHPGAIIMGFRR